MPYHPKRAAIIQFNIEMKNVVFGSSSLAVIVLALLVLLIWY